MSEQEKVTIPDDAVILDPVGIALGQLDSEMQYYQFVAKDLQGKTYLMTFGILHNYTESLEKLFSRFYPIRAPRPEEQLIEIDLDKENTDDITAGKD